MKIKRDKIENHNRLSTGRNENVGAKEFLLGEESLINNKIAPLISIDNNYDVLGLSKLTKRYTITNEKVP